jgi:hypothetical protein
VLIFRANGRMRSGHVAVVARVLDSREVIVDHANWPSGGGRGGVSHDVAVVDVSEANNWSAVRVELGHGGEFGSVYPTYGFIYDRPDNGFVSASITRPAPQPELNRAPNDLRPMAERPWHTVEEVAEAPAGPPHRIDLSIAPARLASDDLSFAPNQDDGQEATGGNKPFRVRRITASFSGRAHTGRAPIHSVHGGHAFSNWQALSESGRKASSAGVVPISLYKSHSCLLSRGCLTSKR